MEAAAETAARARNAAANLRRRSGRSDFSPRATEPASALPSTASASAARTGAPERSPERRARPGASGARNARADVAIRGRRKPSASPAAERPSVTPHVTCAVEPENEPKARARRTIVAPKARAPRRVGVILVPPPGGELPYAPRRR